VGAAVQLFATKDFFFFYWKHMLPLTKGSRLIAGDQINYKVWCMIQKHVRIIHTPSIGVV
jgi:hypothetical protein